MKSMKIKFKDKLYEIKLIQSLIWLLFGAGISIFFILVFKPIIGNSNSTNVSAIREDLSKIEKLNLSIDPLLDFAKRHNFDFSNDKSHQVESQIDEVSSLMIKNRLGYNLFQEKEYLKNAIENDDISLDVAINYINEWYLNSIPEMISNGKIIQAINNVNHADLLYREFNYLPLNEEYSGNSYYTNRILFYNMLMNDSILIGMPSALKELMFVFDGEYVSKLSKIDGRVQVRIYDERMTDYLEYKKGVSLFNAGRYNEAVTIFRKITDNSINLELNNLCNLMITRSYYWNCVDSNITIDEDLLGEVQLIQTSITHPNLWDDIGRYYEDLAEKKDIISSSNIRLASFLNSLSKKDIEDLKRILHE